MKKRILSSVVLVPLLLAILLIAPKILTAILFAVLAALGAYELLHNTGLVRHTRLLIYTSAMAFLVPIWCYFGMPSVWGHAGILLFFGLLFMEMMMSHIKLRIEKVAICVVGGLLIPYLLSNPVRLLTAAGGRYLVMLPFVAAFLGDTGAYFIGCKFGQRKLAPVISPNKSVEGVIGSILCAVVGMLLYTMIMQLGFHHKVNYFFAVIYGIVGSLSGVFGDLCFSVLKRQTGIKDYGNLIPGHGGVLDRFDALMVVGSVLELLIMIIPVVVIGK